MVEKLIERDTGDVSIIPCRMLLACCRFSPSIENNLISCCGVVCRRRGRGERGERREERGERREERG